MSCSSDSNNNPCTAPLTTTESMASSINNLIENLFGTFTKVIVNGRATWTAVCSPNEDGIPCYPRLEGEGYLCYVIRVLSEIGTFPSANWDINSSYCKNTIVGVGDSIYFSVQAVPAGIAISNTTYWAVLITVPAGPVGPMGPAGAAGGGSAISYSTRVITISDSLQNTDAAVYCEPAAPLTLTIPAMAGLDAGKWFLIRTNGAHLVTLTPSGGDTCDIPSLKFAGETVLLTSNGDGNWYVA